jgi:molecular chaperone GrpE
MMSESETKPTGHSGAEQSSGGAELGNAEMLDFATRELAGATAAGGGLEQLRGQLAEAENRALRYQADLDNFRRRTRRELDEQLKYASLGLISGILDSLDNLERALSAIPADQADSSVSLGVRMVAQQIHETLRAAGCQKIDAEGQAFDPKLHQAVQTLPSETAPINQVLQEFRTGYQLYDRVIRPAQVVVSSGPGGN